MTLASSTAGPEAVEAAIAIQKVHTALFPSHGPTPLHPLPKLAEQLGCKAVYAKDESSRFDLPAFKILGASWCACSMLGERWGLLPWDIEGIKQAAAGEPELTLYAATDGKLRPVKLSSLLLIVLGNHGRAVARTARLLGLKAHVFVPSTVEQWSIDAIASEGCPVTPVDDDYDGTVEAANAACRAAGKIGLLIQDMSWPGYEDAPKVCIVSRFSPSDG
jgi:diaminopropionate ammonia-lyase